MKLEDLNMGAVIMHADAKTNPIHTGTMYIVLKIDKEHEDIEACCINCQIGTAIGEVRHISTRSISEYNMLFQILIAPPAVRSNPTATSKDLYLRWAFGKKTSLGKVGVKTPYKLENGRNLFVGDVVSIKNDYMEEKTALWCMTKMMAITSWELRLAAIPKQVKLRISLYLLKRVSLASKNGDTFATTFRRNGIEVVDFIPEE